MTKLETVKNLPDARLKHATGEQMSQLQEALQAQRQTLATLAPQLESLQHQIGTLPLEISTLAAAICPLAQALHQLVPMLQSLQALDLDKRLQAIEAVLPRKEDGTPVMLAAQGTLQASQKEVKAVRDHIVTLATAFPQDGQGHLLTLASEKRLI